MLSFFKNSYTRLLLWFVVIIATSFAVATITKDGPQSQWYLSLQRSPLTPPSFVFPLVWSFLYMLIAYCGWKIFESPRDASSDVIRKVYLLQLGLNFSWSLVFFKSHQITAALMVLLALLYLVGWLLLLTRKTLPSVSFCLLPYFLWLTVACYLNFYIWIHL